MAKKLVLIVCVVVLLLSVAVPAYAYRSFTPEMGDGWLSFNPGDVVVNETQSTVLNCWLDTTWNSTPWALHLVVIDGNPNYVWETRSQIVFVSYLVAPGSVIEFDNLWGMCQVEAPELNTPPIDDNTIIRWF